MSHVTSIELCSCRWKLVQYSQQFDYAYASYRSNIQNRLIIISTVFLLSNAVSKDLHYCTIPVRSEADRKTETEMKSPFIMPHELYAYLMVAGSSWSHISSSLEI